MGSEAELSKRLNIALADRYRVVREIGSGGMATVYLATDLRHARNVALKVLRPDLAASLGAERFLQEVRVTANLQHPHILPLFDSGEADEFLFYVMPFIEGESLRERLVRENELPVTQAARLLRDVADALAMAHKLGVVHRDIKPENVLISGRHAMVADFGVAKAVSEATGRHKLTTLGVALGTPSYMAPEQAAADEAVDHRADIYAFGVMAYELLAGRPPFSGSTPQQILAAQVLDIPQPLTELRASVPPALENLVMRCLEKKPADRWQSTEELLPLLEAAATPSGGITPTSIQSVTRPESRIRRRLAGLIGGVLSVIVLVAGYFFLARDRGPELAENLVAVLPFENRTGDASRDFLGSMAADQITAGISRSDLIGQVVEVVSTQQVRSAVSAQSEGEAVSLLRDPVGAFGRAFGASIIVSGWYYTEGETLLFQAEITSTENERTLETVEVRARAEDHPEALGVLRERVLGALYVALGVRQGDFPDGRFQAPPRHSALLLLEAGEDSFRDYDYAKAIVEYDRAMQLDPTLVWVRLRTVQAFLNLGDRTSADSVLSFLSVRRDSLSYSNQLYHDLYRSQLRGDLIASLVATRRISESEPDRWQPKHRLGRAAFRVNRPQEAIEALLWVEAEASSPWFPTYSYLTQSFHVLSDHKQELDWALRGREKYPTETGALRNQMVALAAMGWSEEVARLLDEVLTLSGGRPALEMRIAAMEFRAHGFGDEANEVLERARSWLGGRPLGERETPEFRSDLAITLYLSGRWEEALEIFEGLAGDDPESVLFQGYLGDLAARTGDHEGAHHLSDRLAAVDDPYVWGMNTYYRARIASLLGEREQAVGLLREAHGEGFPFSLVLHRDIAFEPLRGFQPFEDFLRPEG